MLLNKNNIASQTLGPYLVHGHHSANQISCCFLPKVQRRKTDTNTNFWPFDFSTWDWLKKFSRDFSCASSGNTRNFSMSAYMGFSRNPSTDYHMNCSNNYWWEFSSKLSRNICNCEIYGFHQGMHKNSSRKFLEVVSKLISSNLLGFSSEIPLRDPTGVLL